MEYLQNLSKDKSKNSKIHLEKINDYVSLLSKYGTFLGAPYVKKIGDDLWELRPLNNRIFFFTKSQDGYVLLHAFRKTSQKTPKLEIKRAIREIQHIREDEKNE